MNGLIANIFGWVLSITSIFVLGLIFYFSSNLDPRAFGFASGSQWLVGIFLITIYVLIVGYLTVLVHTRELAEKQVKLLEEIKLQLNNQLSARDDGNTDTNKTEPIL